jgi:uncharacterized protein (TIGR03435 family)
MVVEAIFWFNPLVWWVGSRMVEERELACDEEVLRMGCEPTDYVEGILKVCRFYTELPLSCISGVTGADVKKRLRAILAGSIAPELSGGKKVTLATVGLAAVAVPILIGVLNAPAQNAPPTTPKFEVASVKQNQISRGGISRRITPGNLIYTNIALAEFFQLAYGLSPRQLSGPDWLIKDRYDIVAKSENPAASPQEIKLMLRALLEDRFKVAAHHESREMPVLALVTTKDGPKFRASSGNAPQETKLSIGGYQFKNTSMSDFARFLSPFMPRMIVDRTGLKGLYDFAFSVEAIRATANDTDERKEAVFDAVQDSMTTALSDLGLKFESQRAPMDFVVIDHMERVPTEN